MKTNARKGAAQFAAEPVPAPLLPNEPTLPFAQQIVDDFEVIERTKAVLNRYERLKTATKQIAGVGQAMSWRHGDYLISLVLVRKPFTRRCDGCIGIQDERVEQHFKVQRLVPAAAASINAA